ncbi:MAG: type II secretion system protein M [Legionella sp.]|nr:type II secretion system protein M [Legionella sp.]
MMNYFKSLNERERWITVLGGLSIALFLYYLFLYEPLTTQIEQKRTLLAEKIETLKWMKGVQHQSQKTSKKSLDNSQLLTVISDQLKQNPHLKFPYQLQQISSGDIQLSFDKVPFNFFLLWLEKINAKYEMKIKQFNVDPTNTSGVTHLELIISNER